MASARLHSKKVGDLIPRLTSIYWSTGYIKYLQNDDKTEPDRRTVRLHPLPTNCIYGLTRNLLLFATLNTIATQRRGGCKHRFRWTARDIDQSEIGELPRDDSRAHRHTALPPSVSRWKRRVPRGPRFISRVSSDGQWPSVCYRASRRHAMNTCKCAFNAGGPTTRWCVGVIAMVCTCSSCNY